jgi:hypothetical protein
MNKNYSLFFLGGFALALFTLVNGCEKDFEEPAAAPQSKSLTEEFDTVANLYNKDWVFVNNSNPIGAATWQQGVYAPGKLGPDGWPAFSYHSSADEYLFAGYQAGGGIATISSWAITPALEMKNGDKFSFYTRTFTGSTFADRLQVRINYSDNSADVGRNMTSFGKFTTLLVDINPTLTANGYPQTWTKYEFTVSGLAAPVKRRIGFRYFVTNGGPSGANSNAIGIDQFKFESL